PDADVEVVQRNPRHAIAGLDLVQAVGCEAVIRDMVRLRRQDDRAAAELVEDEWILSRRVAAVDVAVRAAVADVRAPEGILEGRVGEAVVDAEVEALRRAREAELEALPARVADVVEVAAGWRDADEVDVMAEVRPVGAGVPPPGAEAP